MSDLKEQFKKEDGFASKQFFKDLKKVEGNIKNQMNKNIDRLEAYFHSNFIIKEMEKEF